MTINAPISQTYKKFYLSFPYDDLAPVSDWDTFRSIYLANYPEALLPDQAPSLMDSHLEEGNIFTKQRESDVTIFPHLNYTPDFIHQLDMFKIIYILRGQARFTTKADSYHLTSGMLCLVPPGIEQSLFVADNTSCVYNLIIRQSSFQQAFSAILYDSNDLSGILWQMIYSKNKPVLLCQTDTRKQLKNYILQIIAEENGALPFQNTIQRSLTIILLSTLWRFYSEDIRLIEQSVTDSRLSLFIEMIDKNLATITLSQLAERTQLSEGYLSRYLKEATGMTFKKILKDIRLNRSLYLLKHTNFPIEKISEMVGYRDQSRFYRNFKEIFQQTPNTYRKS